MFKLMTRLFAFVLLVGSFNAACASNFDSDEAKINAVLTFWFDSPNADKPIYNRGLWWVKNPNTDEGIRESFADLRDDAILGHLNHWLETPEGTLAYIILIDQFSRNLHRDTPEMYTHDDLALAAAKIAVDRGYDRNLSLTERVFLYMPFQHSEDLNDQMDSVECYVSLYTDTPEDYKPTAINFLRYAIDHQWIVSQFGRFPHRNRILSRESTDAELAFMKTHSGY